MESRAFAVAFKPGHAPMMPGADAGVFTKGYSAIVQPHAAMTLRISPVTDAT